MNLLRLFCIALLAVACTAVSSGPAASAGAGAKDTRPYEVPAEMETRVLQKELSSAVFAGGCFWCLETAFEPLPGVLAAISGYSGGGKVRPSYEEVGQGTTGHTEVVRVIYDPKKITYERLLDVFWRNIDPTQANGQFCDRGPQYRSAIFYGNEAEKAAAVRTRDALKLSTPIVTEITAFEAFFSAENYHQDFYKTNPDHYRAYREGCGRDRRLQQLWGVTPH